jgi:hypothetical protein
MGIVAKARTVRRTIIDMAVRRQRRGYGSLLSRLERDVFVEDWWTEVESILARIPHAVIGGVAANAYMAPRFTRDLDVGVPAADLSRAESALESAGWRRSGEISPTDPELQGCAWTGPGGQQVDLFGMQHRWAPAALRAATRDPCTGVVTLPVGYVVLMKLTVSRAVDLGDLTRLLGGRSDKELAEIRVIVRRFGGPDDPEDLEQLIALGRLERDDRS